MKPRLVVIIVTIVVAAFVIVLATRPASNSETAANPLVGQPSPPVVGTALDGRSVDLAQMRGRWVVVNFFATWCIPCREEHPELIEFTRRHPEPTAPTVVAVAFDSKDVANARSFFAQNGGTWPVVQDDGGRIAVNYGVRGLPESYVVDPEGKIAARITGKVTANDLDSIVKGVS